MELLEKIDFGVFERLTLFNEFLPFTKIKIIMVIATALILVVEFNLFMRLDFPKLKSKYFIWISLAVLFIGLVVSYKRYPTNNFEMIYPAITSNQKLYKYGNKYILEDASGKKFYVEDGHLRMVETD